MFHLFTELLQRIRIMEDLHGLCVVTIQLGVAHKVTLDPVGLGLDESRSLAGAGTGHCGLCRLIYGKGILPVHNHTGDVVACCPVRDILHVAGGAVRRGGSPAVHLIDKNHRQLPGGGRIHGLVERAAVGGAVAKEHNRHLIRL